MIPYRPAEKWIRYDILAIAGDLVEAKAAVMALRSVPYEKDWADALQRIELKREVAGTSRIEGAEFTERELEASLQQSPENLATRSQRQVRAAAETYRWIAGLPHERPIDGSLILEIHRRMVTGADDDHCPPGHLRGKDQNVTFGQPAHRGVEGGAPCDEAFAGIVRAIATGFPPHDPLVQALAAHYHLAAVHPFLDGNGRTARALEALFLQRAGLRETCFIPMSNYYYEEKTAYLAALHLAGERGHDLTPFLQFALRGVAAQAKRLMAEIQRHLSRGLFRNRMYDLFRRLRSPRKRVLAERQLEILKILLAVEEMPLASLAEHTDRFYSSLKVPQKIFFRDLGALSRIGAVRFEKMPNGTYRFAVRLEWPTEITEAEFFKRIAALPKAKTHSFLS